MATLDVNAAVCAITSSLQAAGDLLADAKKKKSSWRRKPSVGMEREKMIQETLTLAAHQIEQAYESGVSVFGVSFRNGDGMYSSIEPFSTTNTSEDSSRGQLINISVRIQTEIVRSIRVAKEREDAVLDLDKIHEEIIIYKRDSIRILEELKGRSNYIPQHAVELPAEPPSDQNTHNSAFSGSPAPYVRTAEHIASPVQEKTGFFSSKRLSVLRHRSKEAKSDSRSPTERSREPSVVETIAELEAISPMQSEPVNVNGLVAPIQHMNISYDNIDYSDKIIVEGYSDKILVEGGFQADYPNGTLNRQQYPSPGDNRDSFLSSMTDASNRRVSHSSSMLDRISTTSSRRSDHGTNHYTQSGRARDAVSPASISPISPIGPMSALIPIVGRASKSNNFWGFCKGAWTIRENVKKGLSLATIPIGVYSTKLKWQCKSCLFSGDCVGAEKAIDTRIQTDEATSIRYTWLFLAKSHTKRKSSGTTGPNAEAESFGCVFCVDSGTSTSVFGSVAMLMKHVAESHRSLRGDNAAANKWALGSRMVDNWEIHIPFATTVGEY